MTDSKTPKQGALDQSEGEVRPDEDGPLGAVESLAQRVGDELHRRVEALHGRVEALEGSDDSGSSAEGEHTDSDGKSSRHAQLERLQREVRGLGRVAGDLRRLAAGAPPRSSEPRWLRRWRLSVKPSEGAVGSASRPAPLLDRNRVLEMMAAGDPIEEVLDRVVEGVELRMSGLACALVMSDGASGEIATSPSLDRALIQDIHSRLGGSMSGGSGGSGREDIEVCDVASSVRWSGGRDLLTAQGYVRTWCCAVALADGDEVGGLCVLVREGDPLEPSRLQRRVMEEAVSLASIAIGQERTRRELQHQAHHDQLTGLPNRALLVDRLEQAIVMGVVGRHKKPELAVVLVDLDNFKVINESLGHRAGDLVLKAVSRRIRNVLRESDTVARVGGDEFGLLLPVSSAATAAAVVDKLQGILSAPFQVGGRELFVTASFGIGMYPADGGDASSLFSAADSAVFAAKAKGRDTAQFFTSTMNAEARERLALETELRRAIDSGGFVLHYQARVELQTGRITGVEALLRWHHPELGLLLPGRFLAVATAAGLMPRIGELVLRMAAQQVRAWRDQGVLGVVVAVNLSASQFRFSDLAATVNQVIDEFGLDPSWLELEITEDALIDDIDSATAQMQRLKSLEGVKLAIDDFGTGYSSLGYLKQFPVDILKIDKTFICDLAGRSPGAEGDTAIVKTVIELGRNLGLRVVAEGVETEDQLRLLQALKCDEAQGFLLARPVPAEELVDRLRAGGLDNVARH
ncbi:MAG TPA: hypothetical protein DIU15_18945 [Deltaproteobacteria bacterium]|nr:hypothetical protein [Deltaproteobacteria bacterium]HCP48123.1 hypothetical protein [Deltaproteobacteria bacterium]